MKYRLVHQDFAHHTDAEPIDTAGPWKVYNLADVPYGWPGNGVRLAIEGTDEELTYIRNRFPAEPVDPRPLPEPPDESFDA